MTKIKLGWMYPDILNLHGERGSIQAMVKIGHDLGIQVEVVRINDFTEPIPFDELDLMVFLPGEITVFGYIMTALRAQLSQLQEYIENGNYVIAMGTSGLLFGKTITRQDGSVIEGLGLLDLYAKEREYVWGDDLHLRIDDTKQELIGSQILMADVQTSTPFGHTIYGRGNDGSGEEGARYRNLIYTNCLGPLFVKNVWFAEQILKDTILRRELGIFRCEQSLFAHAAFDSTLQFIKKKPPYNP